MSANPTAARVVRRGFWPAIALLAFVGFAASVGRGWGTIESVWLTDGPLPELSRIDRESAAALARVAGLEPGDPLVAELDTQNRRFLGKFNRHPIATLLHVLPGALFMLLAPFQFSSRIRARAVRWHRWAGRLLVAIAIPIGISGLFFGLVLPFSGAFEASAIAAFGAIFFLAAIRGFAAIRKRDVRRHREWMIRLCAVAFGVSVVRLVGTALAFATRTGPESWFGWSLWIGFTSTVVAAELWIRRTRPARATAGRPEPTPARATA